MAKDVASSAHDETCPPAKSKPKRKPARADKPHNAQGKTAASERYHHGDLREALIDAAYEIVLEEGVDSFSMSEACRRAGVSTAAPYRHFKDRDELIGEVAAKGFRLFADATRAARDAHPPASIDGLAAMGRAYVRFVGGAPQLFHLMWGTTRASFPSESAHEASCEGFEMFIEVVEAIRQKLGVVHLTTHEFALPIWSSVHGLASLKQGESLRLVADVDLERMIEVGLRAYLEGAAAAARRAT